jgi:CRP/FNR family cyclic AMP-dependent transcriptional regulator
MRRADMKTPGGGVVGLALSTGGAPAPPTMGRKGIALLERVPLFEGLTRHQLRKVAALAEEVRYGEGRAVVREGARGDAFYVIVDGTARVLRGPTLRRITGLGPGDFFGELALLTGGTRMASVIAETPLVTIRLSRAAFQDVVNREPAVALKIMVALAGRVRRWGTVDG